MGLSPDENFIVAGTKNNYALIWNVSFLFGVSCFLVSLHVQFDNILIFPIKSF